MGPEQSLARRVQHPSFELGRLYRDMLHVECPRPPPIYNRDHTKSAHPSSALCQRATSVQILSVWHTSQFVRSLESTAGLESAVVGMKVGEQKKQLMPPEDTFGKSMFPVVHCLWGERDLRRRVRM
jgi:hypothetical protein